MPGLSSPLLALWRVVLFVTWTLLAIPPCALLLALRLPTRWLARVYWIVVTWLIGLRVRIVRGRLTRARPLLILANHVSYLDIVALGALFNAGFVAKSEVGTWPGFGAIARLGRTVFVERTRTRAGQGRDDILKRLREGEPLILFPEGTSSDGNRVLPFKSALLAVAEPGRRGSGAGTTDTAAERAWVQPVSLAYTRLDGLPVGYGWRPLLAWYGDMDLAPHLWTALGLGTVTVEVIVHDAIDPRDLSSRKVLAKTAERRVAAGVSELLGGRGVGEGESAPAITAMAGAIESGDDAGEKP